MTAPATQLPALRALLTDGRFHHATHRVGSGLWNGLWVYEVKDDSIGYAPALCFYDGDPEQDDARELVKHTGISLGAFR